MAPEQRGPFSGNARKLVMAFDVGTTYSGVSYAVLDPGLVPEIHGVTRYTVFQISLRSVLNAPLSLGSLLNNESEEIRRSQPSCTTIKKAPFVRWVLKQLRMNSLKKRKTMNMSKWNGGYLDIISPGQRAVNFG